MAEAFQGVLLGKFREKNLVKLGIIGMGHMGGYHATVSFTLPSVKLVAIADSNEENLKKIESSDVIKSKDYHTWLDKVDAVIIAVPTEFHFSIAKECLLAGKHVLLEKPITKTIEQAQELFKIARDKNVALHAGHIERFNAAVLKLKEIVCAPYLIQSQRVGPFSVRPSKDSVILDLMIHDLDIILMLVDSPIKKVQASASRIHTNLSDIAVVEIEFENGVIASATASRASHIKRRTMSIHGKNNFVELDFASQDISVYGNTHEKIVVNKSNPLKLEIENFITSVLTKTNLIDADQDIAALALALKIDKILC